MPEHLDASINQEESEDGQYPLKACDHSCAGEDKDATEHQGPDDTPEEYLVLILALYAEEGEEHEEHEEVIHRQRLFDQISCQKLHRFLMGVAWIEQPDASTEHQ